MTLFGELVKFNVCEPVFSIVKVLLIEPEDTFCDPKSVLSLNKGVSSPSAIETSLPLMFISGEEMAVPFKVNI